MNYCILTIVFTLKVFQIYHGADQDLKGHGEPSGVVLLSNRGAPRNTERMLNILKCFAKLFYPSKGLKV